MDEYISREATAKAFCEKCKGYYDGHCVHRGECDIDVIQAAPTADVQPVNQWISVKDRLPNEDDCYLVVIESEICVSIDIAEYSENRWHKHDKVLYWQPLPELPKDGDAK